MCAVVAEQMAGRSKSLPVSDMETILFGGLEHGRFDAAIGAITTSPKRAARVDFFVSGPSVRRVAVANRKENRSDFRNHVLCGGRRLAELSPLIIIVDNARSDRPRHVVYRTARPCGREDAGIDDSQYATGRSF